MMDVHEIKRRVLELVDKIFECLELVRDSPSAETRSKALGRADTLLRRMTDTLVEHKTADEETVPLRKNNGRQRWDTKALRKTESKLESLWYIDGTWKRLGDLTVDDCDFVACRYQRIENLSAKIRQAFEEIQSELIRNKASCVREAFSDESIAQLLCRVELVEKKDRLWKELSQ